jgi:dTDP-4-amino-4,6-dideoxygalactose transaminase
MIAALNLRSITAPFHYIPLHSSPAGLRYGRTNGQLPVTDHISATLLRLPLWYGIGDLVYDVVEQMSECFGTEFRATTVSRE